MSKTCHDSCADDSASDGLKKSKIPSLSLDDEGIFFLSPNAFRETQRALLFVVENKEYNVESEEIIVEAKELGGERQEVDVEH